MDRKEFLKNSLVAGAGLATPSMDMQDEERTNTSQPFTMKFACEPGIFTQAASKDVIDQIKWAYDHGFRAWEDSNLIRRPVAEQNQISKTIQQLGMEFGQFVGTLRSFHEITFAGRDAAARRKVLQEVRESVKIANRMHTKIVHNVFGKADDHLPWDFQMGNAIELLKRIMEIYEKHDITMIMEPMNQRTQPGLFLHDVPQAYAMAKAVDSPHLKILFDIYHVQKQTGNITDTLDYVWDEVGYFQIGDVPGRNEPGTGEIDFKYLFQHIYDKGYRGFAGLEHGISGSGKAGDLDALKAYRDVDPQ